MEKKINLIASTEEISLRLDVFINKHQKDISRTRIKNLILDKKVKLNNSIILDPIKKNFTW
jgi:23S rRNA pseudouridine1911/1915/1917 synthase